MERAAQSRFVTQLKNICGEKHVITDAPRRKVYETDGLTAKRQVPWVVVLPDTIGEVQAIMKLCDELEVPVVARGAGTGLSGGAVPHAEGVLLSLARFNRIVDIDERNRTARVQPGVTNLAISDAVGDLGLFYAPDPSSQIACTIGGNVAENSGGVHCLKYGLTVHNVLAVKLVSPEGECYEVGSDALYTPGYDLLALIHGSEGMLGVIVEVTVKLLPTPDHVTVVMACFDSVGDAASAVADVISAGVLPAGLEMMDRLAIQAAEDFVHAGYPSGSEALLLCELDGIPSDVAAQLDTVKAILAGRHASSVSVAEDDAGRAKLWQGRKAAFPAVGRIAPDYYCMDGTIPRRHLAEVLDKISEMSARYGLEVANVFHAGDGNLHPLILYDANQANELERAEAFGGDILSLCIEVGGTITGEHGVGIEKIDQMCLQFDPATISFFHAVKAAFDGKGLLNPGKAVPTLSRCAEFGAMHVHRGDDWFPHLERF